MGDLAQLTAAPRTDIIPGYVLSPLTLLDIGELEQTFEARHLARGEAAGCGQTALDDVRRGLFSFTGPDFDAEALKAQSLPTIAWMELRKAHKGITPEAAKDLLATCPDQYAVRTAVLDLAGYQKVKKKSEGESGGSPAPNSSTPSNESESLSSTSPA